MRFSDSIYPDDWIDEPIDYEEPVILPDGPGRNELV